MSEENTEQTTEVKSSPVDVDKLQAEVAKLKSINKEAFEARDGYKARLTELESVASKVPTLMEEVTKLQASLQEKDNVHNEFTTKVKDEKLNSVLTNALKEANVASVDTALKLIDKTKVEFEDLNVKEDSVKAIIEALQTEHSVLFNQPKKETPKPGSATDVENKGGYINELKALRESGKATPMQLAALRKKYGRDTGSVKDVGLYVKLK